MMTSNSIEDEVQGKDAHQNESSPPLAKVVGRRIPKRRPGAPITIRNARIDISVLPELRQQSLRATPAAIERHRFVREYVRDHRDDFVEAGRVLDQAFGTLALQRKRTEQIERGMGRWGRRRDGKPRPAPLSEPWVPTPFVQLLEAANHLECVELTSLKRVEREAACRQILLIEWLATDPDALELVPRLSSLQEGEWYGVMGREWVRHQLAEDETWSAAVKSAIQELTPTDAVGLFPEPPASERQQAPASKPPLTDTARAVYELLCALPEDEGRTACQISKWLAEHRIYVGEGHLRDGIRAELLSRGLLNKRGVGYFIPVHLRPPREGPSTTAAPGE